MPTLSCSSDSNKSKFLDEIALLKRGKITRDTPRSTYKRGLSSEDPNKAPIDDDKPITLAELNTRGLQVDEKHIIYTFPDALVLHNSFYVSQQLILLLKADDTVSVPHILMEASTCTAPDIASRHQDQAGTPFSAL
ncbi:hypothetical protein TELCIR_19971 [Teladorsagia circumcincta]|uniref:Uncharacterized protein n=1 Tax=Teladorsagia circumcincta TaxID=45464 RepID=A0A2G9TKT1_TELCI|nr:hypothetical protein TELCIR_19971 [Teladorsagia circumcincta]